MDTAIQIFNNPQFGEIRATTTEDGTPVFCLTDLCKALDLQTNKVKDRLDSKGWNTIPFPTNGGIQNIIFVTEKNLYKTIFQSRKPEAEVFTDWVTSEILPSIRKHGAYLTNQKLEDIASNPDLLIELANTIKKEREEKLILQQQNEFQQEQIKKITPKAEYFDNVLISKSTYVTDQIAKELGMTAIKLNKLLFQKGIQFKRNGQWVLTTRFCNSGYTRTNTYYQPDGLGGTTSRMSTVWTEKGRLLIHKIYDGEIIRTGSCVPT